MGFLELISRFRGKRILVVGDLMVDEYIFGTVDRISPEAPVPIVDVKEVRYKLGGAANVAANLSALGAVPSVVGVIGADQKAGMLKQMLKEIGAETKWVVTDGTRPTTVKTRIIAGSQQLLRVDWESRDYLVGSVKEEVLEIIEWHSKSYDAVIISDYGKGVIVPELFSITKELKKLGKIINLDPKDRNFPIYKDLTTMTPNKKETLQAVGISPETDEQAKEAGLKLIEKFSLDFATITRSEKGISVVAKDFVRHIPASAKQVYDVTGAGDTVISVLTLALASGAHPVDAAKLANAAGGVVVGKLGTAVVTPQELARALKGVDA